MPSHTQGDLVPASLVSKHISHVLQHHSKSSKLD
jgi:hypothetical protein